MKPRKERRGEGNGHKDPFEHRGGSLERALDCCDAGAVAAFSDAGPEKRIKHEKKKSKKQKKEKDRVRRSNHEQELKDSGEERADSEVNKEHTCEAKDENHGSSQAQYRHVAITSDGTARPVGGIIESPYDRREPASSNSSTTALLLCYQYVEPPWTNADYEKHMAYVKRIGKQYQITGRIRMATEGINCTVTAPDRPSMISFITSLQSYLPLVFTNTEFKVTTGMPKQYQFSSKEGLKIIPVSELVHYGLPPATMDVTGKSMSNPTQPPSISKYGGVHLEPAAYHSKLSEPNTVIIDVRNHYEAKIGHFVVNEGSKSERESAAELSNAERERCAKPSAPASSTDGPEYLDPKMRKSTEFPLWLQQPSTQEKLRGKQVLMYCTGGIRCERASALLNYEIANNPSMSDLQIQGVYQLQGGIDKYFREFPTGGNYWKGKNYVFDKRFVQALPDDISQSSKKTADHQSTGESEETTHETTAASKSPELILSTCESCHKPWDQFRGKRRCPTCGVPSLLCYDCYKNASVASKASSGKKRKLNSSKIFDDSIRCDLCVEQQIFSKRQLREKEEQAAKQYAESIRANGLSLPVVLDSLVQRCDQDDAKPSGGSKKQRKLDSGEVKSRLDQASGSASTHSDLSRVPAPNPEAVTRLYVKNMCRKNMTEALLVTAIPAITHIVWRCDRVDHHFLGQAWVEVATASDAAYAVGVVSGHLKMFGRTLYVEYQAPDGKDLWPPPHSAVCRDS
jgi:predicted sulfurtransferase